MHTSMDGLIFWQIWSHWLGKTGWIYVELGLVNNPYICIHNPLGKTIGLVLIMLIHNFPRHRTKPAVYITKFYDSRLWKKSYTETAWWIMYFRNLKRSKFPHLQTPYEKGYAAHAHTAHAHASLPMPLPRSSLTAFALVALSYRMLHRLRKTASREAPNVTQ